MAKKYAALHLGSFTDAELTKAKNAKDRVKSKYLLFFVIVAVVHENTTMAFIIISHIEL